MTTTDTPTDIKYYLGIPVRLLEEFEDGWCRGEWDTGKVYRHWRAQLLDTPWGHRLLSERLIDWAHVLAYAMALHG